MRDVISFISKIAFYILAVAVFLWCASMTITLVRRLLPNDDITPFFALGLFDVGALVWAAIFMGVAEGLAQRAIAAVAFMADLVGVIGVVLAELLLGGQQLAQVPDYLGQYVVYGVGIYTAINLIAIYAFHISNPDVVREIVIRSLSDKVEAEAFKQVESQIQDEAHLLAASITRRLRNDVLFRLSLPIEPVIIEAQAGTVPEKITASANTEPNFTTPPKSSGQRRS